MTTLQHSAELDGLRTQLLWDRLLALVEEQAQTLMRTAFSTVVREAGDLSAGVFDTRGRMVAQAVTGTPGHVNAMAASVGKFLQRLPLSGLVPGDVLLTNDPWDGTGHLNDFTVVTPVFNGQRCVALFAATSHIADVGGRGFGPDANELFEEGLRIPITYLFQAGVRNDLLLDILKANVRDPVVAEGDLYSLTACNDAGAEQLLATLAEFEQADLDAIGEHIISTSERAMRAAIADLDDGCYQHQTIIDGYDEPLTLRCSLTISGDRVHIDFAGSPPASRFGINVPLPYTQAYASFGVRCIVGGDIPNNAGSLAPIAVVAEAGSLLAALAPSAVSARHSVGQMLPDLVLGALAQLMPDRVPAEGASCIWNPVLRGGDWVINPIFNGGTGARPMPGSLADKDGLSTTAFPSGVRTTSTEINEVSAPLVFWRREYAPNSGGNGTLRGGLGQRVEIEHRLAQPFIVSKMFDRVNHPAAGRDGGDPGAPGIVAIELPAVASSDPASQSQLQPLAGKGADTVPAGARLILQTPGGGGIGSPQLRADDAARGDRQAGLVSD
ncbi:MAG: hydantoinase B/oxoprolinase family protein [Pseudomonadales bacterium]